MFKRVLPLAAAIVAVTTFSIAFAGATSERTARAAVDRHVILAQGAPFFPVMLIDQCTSEEVAQARHLGINAILNEHCDAVPPHRQLTLIQSSAALAILPIHDRNVRGSGLLGWSYPDEPENNGWTPSSLRRAHPYLRGNLDGLLSFVTTSGGFFQKPYTDPRHPPSVYGNFARMADVAGFDLYPLGHCQSDLSAVYVAQRAFIKLAGSMPTFQWIETGPIKPTYCGGFKMTPAELNAEVWLAVVGGARGIGFFTHTWSPVHRAFDVSPTLKKAMGKISDLLASVKPGLVGFTVLSGVKQLGQGRRACRQRQEVRLCRQYPTRAHQGTGSRPSAPRRAAASVRREAICERGEQPVCGHLPTAGRARLRPESVSTSTAWSKSVWRPNASRKPPR